jgi:DNA-binding SARP family transcriptional activator/tetratricopeptide (TPR) repeat protein
VTASLGGVRERSSDLVVGLLGQLEVSVDGRPVRLTTGRLRTLLAVLAMSAGKPVSMERLAAAVWSDEQPDNSRRSLQTYAQRLRGALGEKSLETRPEGLVLRTDPDSVDALRFVRMVERTRSLDADQQRRLLDEALGLWRGEPFEGVASRWLAATEAPRLVEEHLAALERRIDLDIVDARHYELVARIGQLVARYPDRESLWVRLLLVLDRCGRQAEALERYEQIRRHIADELGVDPGAELQQTYQDLLAGRPVQARLTTPAGVASQQRAEQVVPRQLPADLASFVGRASELDDLDRVWDSPVTATVIDGMAGIGKTALAVRVAHRIAGHYPDGQLFLDLHGFTEGITPVPPGEALDRLLRTLGLPGAQIPADLDERAALYRSLLAEQRMLIVLDNAATETQVQPLLPGTRGCLVLVTSRRRLAGLDHCRTLSLDTLPVPDAVELFTRTAGGSQLAGQPPELQVELVELCGRLPLAIRIAAARLRSHPTWKVSNLVERLRDRQHRLGELEAGQRNVIAALDLSYQDLDPDQRRTYRLLGLHPGPDIDAYATAAMLDFTLQRTGRMLDQLYDAHLLQEPATRRYRFHDLVRAHAAHTAAHEDTQTDHSGALERLLDYYRHTAAGAMNIAYPYERERRPQVPRARTAVPELPDSGSALEWLDTELPNLLASAEHGHPAYVLHLSAILHRHLRTRGRYQDAETLHRQALVAASAAADQVGRVTALVGLGDVHRLQGCYPQAADHYRQALQLAHSTGHHPAELDALTGLGDTHWRQGRYAQAADHYQQALQLARTTGHHPAELDALVGLGYIHTPGGRHRQAADHFGQALRLARATGHHPAELNALVGLGYVNSRWGRHRQAADHYQQALQLALATDNRPSQLNSLIGLSSVQSRSGCYAQAADYLEQALRLARATGHRPAELNALVGLGYIHSRWGRYPQAADHFERALRLARATGNSIGELDALTGLGQAYRLQGRFEQASHQYGRLLDLAQENGDRRWQFEARQGLGRLQHATGHPDAAVTHHEKALALASELSQPDEQARAHDGLACAHDAQHQHDQAREHWQHALNLLTVLGVDHTEDGETTLATIRAQLAATAPRSPAAGEVQAGDDVLDGGFHHREVT